MSNKKDRRSQRTRHMLGQAFVELLKEKGYSAMTVSDLIERANIGRSTFYSHYRDKDDLFVNQLDRMIEALSHQIPEQEEMPYFPSLGLFQHVGEQYELYKSLLWTPGIDLFIKHMQKSLSQRIEQKVQKHANGFDIPHSIVATFIAGSFLTVLRWWLENKMVPAPEEMDKIFKRLVSSGIKKAEG